MINLGEEKMYSGLDGDLYDKGDLINALRLQRELVKDENVLFSIDECINIWQNYSSSLAASWLFFPEKDEDILSYIKGSDYFESFEKWAAIDGHNKFGLRPCPFCSSDELLIQQSPSNDGTVVFYKIHHQSYTDCGVTLTHTNKEQLIQHWNKY